jgi:hypothetical protein
MSSTMSPCGFDTEWGLTKPHPLDRCAEFLVHSAAPLILFAELPYQTQLCNFMSKQDVNCVCAGFHLQLCRRWKEAL